MNKKRTLWAVIMMLSLTAGALSGCGKKATADNLLREMQKSVGQYKSAEISTLLDMDINYRAEEEDEQISHLKLELDMQTKVSMGTDFSGADGTMTIQADGAEFEQKTGSYLLLEDGKRVRYSALDDIWIKEQIKQEDFQQRSFLELMTMIYEKEYMLEKEKKQLEEKEVYVLTAELTGEEIARLFYSMNIDLLDSAVYGLEFAYSGLRGKIELDLDSKTKLPIAIYVDLSENIDMFEGDNLFAASELNTFIIENMIFWSDEEIETAVPESVLNNYLDLDIEEREKEETEEETEGQEETQPESSSEIQTESVSETEQTDSGDDVLWEEAPESNAEPIDEDGYYILQNFDSNDTVKVGVPDGFYKDENSENTCLVFNSNANTNNHNISANYQIIIFNENYTEADVLSSFANEYNYYQDDPSYSGLSYSGEQTTTVGDKTVKYGKITYCYENDGYYTNYIMWTMINGKAVICDLREYATDNPQSAIDEGSIFHIMMSKVKE